MEAWLVYALLSAGSAAMVSIFGKIGLNGIDSNAATAVRAIIMAVFLVGVVAVQGSLNSLSTVLADRKALLFIALSGIAGATSWLFYFMALRWGRFLRLLPLISSALYLRYFWQFSCLARRLACYMELPLH